LGQSPVQGSPQIGDGRHARRRDAERLADGGEIGRMEIDAVRREAAAMLARE